MFLTNHALTGVLIGLELPQPAAIVPVAFASHFVLDGLPHHDRPGWKHYAGFSKKSFLITGSVDSVVATGVTVGACLLWPDRAVQIVLGSFFALLPDLLYVPEILFKLQIDKRLRPFHAWAQWWTGPWGGLMELGWAMAMVGLILGLN